MLRDLAAAGGLLLITAGIGWIYPPAGLIFAGVAILSVHYLTRKP